MFIVCTFLPKQIPCQCKLSWRINLILITPPHTLLFRLMFCLSLSLFLLPISLSTPKFGCVKLHDKIPHHSIPSSPPPPFLPPSVSPSPVSTPAQVPDITDPLSRVISLYRTGIFSEPICSVALWVIAPLQQALQMLNQADLPHPPSLCDLSDCSI